MNDSKATVYGRPGCVQCKYTTKLLDKENVPYLYVDIDQNEVAHQEVKNLDLGTALPVVVTNSGNWAGFRPDMIRSLRD